MKCPWQSSYDIKDYPHRLSDASPEIKRRDEPFEEHLNSSNSKREDSAILFRKWPTSWSWQFLVLTARTFRQSRHVILSKLNFLQAILLTVISSIIWFQVPPDERGINDRIGYVSILFDYYYC